MIDFINQSSIKETKEGFFTGTNIPFSIEPKNDAGQLHGEVIWNYENGVAKRKMTYENNVMLSDVWFYNDGVEKRPDDKSCGCVASISEGVNTSGRSFNERL